jgi:ABC-2 type transport system permease protein
MKLLLDLQVMFWRKLLETLRNPVWIFTSLSTPVIYLSLFAPLLKKLTGTAAFSSGNVLDTFVPGLLVIVAFFNGLFAGWGVIDELRSGVVERFRVTPASRFALLAGPVLRDLVNLLVIVVFFAIIAIPFGFSVDWAGFLVLLPLLSLLLMTTSSFANALGLILKDEDRLAPVVQGVNLPVLLLSGVLLPMSLAPGWLLFIAHLNPVYYVVEAARQLTAGHILQVKVGEAYLVMVPLTSAVMAWATRAYGRAIA